MNPDKLHRQKLYNTCEGELIKAAYHAIYELGENPAEIALVLIHVDDTNGGMIIDAIMERTPEKEKIWQSFRDKGQLPIVVGVVEAAPYRDVFGRTYPDLAAVLAHAPSNGKLHTYVIDAGGVAIFETPYRMEAN